MFSSPTQAQTPTITNAAQIVPSVDRHGQREQFRILSGNTSIIGRSHGFDLVGMNDSGTGGVRVSFTVEGGNETTDVIFENPTGSQFNDLRGNVPANWTPSTPGFRSARYVQIHDGLDLEIYVNRGAIEYDIHLSLNARIESLSFRVDGAKQITTTAEGVLLIETEAGMIQQTIPAAYFTNEAGSQTRTACRFRLLGANRFGFSAERESVDSTLTIDPKIVFSTFAGGGSKGSYSASLKLGVNSEIYVSGGTGSSNFPITPGAFDTTYAGGFGDSTLQKYSANGANLIFSTFIGGSGTEQTPFLQVDSLDSPHVALITSSQDLVVTPGAPFTNPTPENGYIIKLDPTGSAALFATYLGRCRIHGLGMDASNRIYCGGDTPDTQFFTTPGSFMPSYQGGNADLYLMGLDPQASTVRYSTFLGGAGMELPAFVNANLAGEAIIGGYTYSANYPSTPGSFSPTFQSWNGTDTFLTQLNSSGTSLVFSTFFKRALPFSANFDSKNDIYVGAVGYPDWVYNTFGVYKPTSQTGGALIAKFLAGGTLYFSTFLLEGFPEGASPVPDSKGNIVFSGSPNSTTTVVPVTLDALQKTPTNSSSETYHGKLNSTGTGLIYCSYLGGTQQDFVGEAAIDPNDNIYFCGSTNSPNFPITPGAYDSALNPKGSGYIMKLELPDTPFGSELYGVGTPGCTGVQKLMINQSPRIGAPGFKFACDQAPPNALGAVFVSDLRDTTGSDPLFLGVKFHVGLFTPALWALDIQSNGLGVGMTLPFDIPNNPALVGQVFYSQALWQWGAGSCTLGLVNLSSSNGIAITILQ